MTRIGHRRNILQNRASLGFPLFQLPFLPMQRVLGQIDVPDLIDLSLCSKRCVRSIGALKSMPIRMEIHIDKTSKTVRLFRRLETVLNCFSWMFQYSNVRNKNKLRRNINDVTVFCGKFSSKWNGELKVGGGCFETARKETKETASEMGAVVTHLLNTFHKCRLEKVFIDFEGLQSDFDIQKIFKSPFSVGSLKCQGTSETCRQDIEHILKTVKITNSFSSWNPFISRESLLSLNAPYTELQDTKFQAEDVIEFLKKWKTSCNMERVKTVSVSCSEHLFTLDLTQFDGKPWDPVKRAKVYRYNNDLDIDCSRGIDIEREDGLLATFLPASLSFWFLVWHDRFPSREAE